MKHNEPLKHLQGLMLFLASIANGVEELVGRGAPGVTFRAGRNVAMKATVVTKEQDLLKAIEAVAGEMENMGMRWDVEIYKKESEQDYIHHDEEADTVKLVFRNCMVRSCQFHYGHPQKNSLCMLNHGLFCGLLQKIYGEFSEYEFIHSGENACIGSVKIKKRRIAA
jgi:predicted hydrocarbon binding protein